MELQSSLMDLEDAVGRVSDGLNAVRAMVMGMDEADNPYSGGFYAIWLYLDEANRQVQKHLSDCLNAV